ncbi:MAG: ABC transporter substrate-binding protein [Rhodospirillales bacterium]|nr:ABC transporter substrate-binding protein [Rhodospirillales bacterium]
MNRPILAALAAGVLGVVVPAVHAAKAQTFHIALREDPDLLDPTLGQSYVGRIVFAGLCDKLFDIDSKLNVVPMLATSFKWESPTALVIHLRPGVTFQDGTKLDAAAVVYTIERDLTMQGSARKGELANVTGAEVVDPLTVKISLSAPNAGLVAQLTDRAGMIVSPTAAKKEGRNFALHPVCAGPFAFAKRIPQDEIVLDRYPGYWNAKSIHFNQVIYRPFPNGSVRLANLQAGAIDLSEQILPTDVAAVKKNPKLEVVISPGLGYNGITFNTNNGPQAKTPIGESALVRKAFELSIDRKALSQVVFNGMYPPTAQALSLLSPYHDTSIAVAGRDVAKAKALLKQAGVKLPVPVTLTITSNSDAQQMGVVIQSMAKEAGFDVKLRTLEFATSLQAGHKGDFQAYLIGWSGRVDPDGNLTPFLRSGSFFNYGHYSNPTMDKLLSEGLATTDFAKRKAIYDQVQELSNKDLPLMYLYTLSNIVGMKKSVQGFVPVPDGMIRLQGVSMSK